MIATRAYSSLTMKMGVVVKNKSAADSDRREKEDPRGTTDGRYLPFPAGAPDGIGGQNFDDLNVPDILKKIKPCR